jgi:hypothetical protein
MAAERAGRNAHAAPAAGRRVLLEAMPASRFARITGRPRRPGEQLRRVMAIH